MYRLVLYGLVVIFLGALILSFFSFISYSPTSMLISAGVLFLSCYFINYVFSKSFKADVNAESAAITALILALIMPPVQTKNDLIVLAIAGLVATASKYLLAPLRRHVFNPAALGAFSVFILGIGGATWWAGTPVLLPLILIVGLLIVRKIRRFAMFSSFVVSALASIIIFNYEPGVNIAEILIEAFTSWPIIFFGTIMLTEPITTPPTKKLRLLYGIGVGILFGSQFHVWRIIPTPEFVLLAGNIFSYLTGFKPKLSLTLIDKREIAKDVIEFSFESDRKINFRAGQYLEYTMPHKNDSRGNRRYFTIASSPTENQVRLGIKTNPAPSSFKKTLLNMNLGNKISAGQLAGDFVLPEDSKKKLVFLAGGIGITPFRSMVKYLIDKNQPRNAILLYSAKTEEEIAYRELFNEAIGKIGLRTEYVVAKIIDANLIREKVPDFKERIFYISGPEGMVNAFKKMLRKMGVAGSNIVTDYFPGFA